MKEKIQETFKILLGLLESNFGEVSVSLPATVPLQIKFY